MSFRIKPRSKHRSTTFLRRRARSGNQSESHKRADVDAAEMQSSDSEYCVPSLHTTLPVLRDELETETSLKQKRVVQDCLPYLQGKAGNSQRNTKGIPYLDRDLHAAFVTDFLEDARFLAYDPQRPWLLYWNLNSLALLGEETASYGARVVKLISALQRPDGGIGGGPGHLSHALPTYAAVLGCAITGPEALECFDRKSMWLWLGRLKQPDGGFAVSEGAEVDVRGLYCAMTVITLLNLPLDLPQDAPARRAGLTSFLDNATSYLSRCQTFEGGISGSPGSEAHGAYTFCAIACACILGVPAEIIPKTFHMPSLIRWLSARQYAPEGGFSGRTNKLVDGCYSHWVGGCWPLIGAALPDAADAAGGVYSREGLIRYILTCCQQPDGGLRDKPSVYPDSYHSCYVLSGLSSAQRINHYNGAPPSTTVLLPWAFGWEPAKEAFTADEETSRLFGQADTVEAVHPVFVIPFTAVSRVHDWCQSKQGF